MKISLVILMSLLVLTSGCTEESEGISDISRLAESENKLPVSVLPKPDIKLESKISSSAPALKEHTVLSKVIERTNGKFTLNGIKWEEGNLTLYVNASGGGTFWYSTYHKCTQSGFFFCKSGYDVDYRFKLRDENDEKYYISIVEGYPRTYTEKNKKGEIVNLTRNKVKFEAGTHNLIFRKIPKSAIRSFDLYEDYCSTSNTSQWSICDVKIKYFDQELEEQKDISEYFKQHETEALSVAFLKKMYEKYAKYDDIKKLLAEAILKRLLQTNSIDKLHEYNGVFKSHDELVEESVDKIFSLLKIKNSVAGYEWFIENYSNSKNSIYALNKIHEIMYSNAKKLDTITSYNTFIINYPTATQVSLAIERSMDLERELYTDFGIFSFINIDKEKEKKARKLLIKAKQIERYPIDNKLGYNEKSGYFIVANRMYDLLQNEFDEADATLRHLESQEFKDFVKELQSSLEKIRKTLEKIKDNTRRAADYAKEAVDVSKKGFSDANADRAMSEYYSKKHREWEKFMHYRDHGYN